MQKLLTLHRYIMLRLCPWKYIASLSWDPADGWGFNNMTGGGHSLDSGKPGALKQQTIGLLHAIAYLRGRAPNQACSSPPTFVSPRMHLPSAAVQLSARKTVERQLWKGRWGTQ